MEKLERVVAERLADRDRGTPADPDESPRRVYALYRDRVPAPAVYVEAIDGDRHVPIIAHNFRYYERAMRRWRLGFVETLVLNELHELTHWAMTDEERAELDARSRERGVPDGYWLNGPLRSVVDWVDESDSAVLDSGTGGLRRLRRRLAWSLRRVAPGVRPR